MNCFSYNVKAKARAGRFRGGPEEHIEDSFLVLGGNAYAIVFYPDKDPLLFLFNGNQNKRIYLFRIVIFDGIGEEVGENHFQPAAVRNKAGVVGHYIRNFDFFCLFKKRKVFYYLPDYSLKIPLRWRGIARRRLYEGNLSFVGFNSAGLKNAKFELSSLLVLICRAIEKKASGF
jgi:hypothetical protein